MIPLGKPNHGPLDYQAAAAGPVSIEQYGVYLRRPCRVCGWRRLLLQAGAVICTNCFGKANGEEGKLQ